MLSLDQLSQTVKEHLGVYSSVDGIQHNNKWKIDESPLAGRGLFATEDIEPGEVLFVDRPLIYGTRAGNSIQRGCTVCCKLNSDSFFKCSKCASLLCSEPCYNTSVHDDDCSIIQRWQLKVPIEEISDQIVSRALTSIRALSLSESQKQFMISLQAHVSPRHWTEISQLQECFEIPEEDVKIMTLASCVLDANAFQVPTRFGLKEMSMRGLYPVSALMNHNCVPNTRYSYNEDLQMSVKAVKAIAAGSEIFTCYTGALWGTPARRMHLYKTKHFHCACERCADPFESGTLLAALKCLSSDCPGYLLPIEPLSNTSPWQCLECSIRVPNKNINAIQHALGSLMRNLDFQNADQLERFLLERITKYIPKTNQIVVDLECRLIWEYGDTDGLRWHELSEARLSLKENLCRGVLRTVTALGAGESRMRGQLLYHLHATLAEHARRCPHLYEDLKSEIESTIEQAYKILQGDMTAPPDLELRHRYLGPGCDKPHEERFFILHA